MYEIGLKLWSINTDYYFEEAKRLYAEKFFSYIELYVIPDTTETVEKWKSIEIPINIHCPHFLNGFNLAQKEKADHNRKIYEQVKLFADQLDSEYIIFHGGVDGSVEETARQLKSFNEPRATMENKPYKVDPNKTSDGIFCRGATVEEIQYIISEVGCEFCLDIGHAICSANSQKIDRWKYLEEFNKLNPNVYHLTDLYDINSEYDSHAHLGHGQMDIRRALTFINKSSKLTVETEKSHKTSLHDFEEDVDYLNECNSYK